MNLPLTELLGCLAAVCSNAVFFTYGWLADLLPVRTLHGVLLPYMRAQTLAAGQLIFSEGEPVKHIYLILAGRVLIERVQFELGQGQLLGEIGVFTQAQQRMAGARSLTEVRIGSLTAASAHPTHHRPPNPRPW